MNINTEEGIIVLLILTFIITISIKPLCKLIAYIIKKINKIK